MALNERAAVTARLVRIRRAVVASRGPAPRRRRLPRQLPPTAIAREYAGRLLALVERVRRECAPLLAELPRLVASAARDRERRADAGEGARVRALIDGIRARLAGAITTRDVETMAQEFARRTATFQRIQILKQTRAALGVDVFVSDRNLPILVEGFVSENVALIKNLPAKIVDDLEATVTRALQSATPHPKLAEEIEARFGFGEERARLIARDQVGKIYGQVNAARQRELGVEHFIWRTVRDERVRDEHDEREKASDPEQGGTPYRYDDPPEGEMPGEPINCRCYAEPVFGDLVAASRPR